MECPFILRGNLTSPDYFYGRVDVVRNIFGYLNKPNPQSISIIGQRRIGKSFLLQYINLCEEIRNKYLGEHSKQFSFIYWDLTRKAPTDPVNFKTQLLHLVHNKLPSELREAFDPSIDVEKLDDELLEGVEILENENHHVVLFFDEFSAITNNPNFDITFFNQKRSLGQSPSLAYVTATAEPLSELCHSEQILASPYFNIFSTMHLTLMYNSEVGMIVQGICERMGIEIEKGAMTEILKLAGGHPCVLATLMDILWKDLRNGKIITHAEIIACKALLYDQFKGDLKYVWMHLRSEEQDALKALLTDQLTIDDLGHSMCHNLHNKSLVRLEKNRAYLFSPVMIDFLSEHADDQVTIKRLFEKRDDYNQNIPILLQTLLLQYNYLPQDWLRDIELIITFITLEDPSGALHKCSRILLHTLLKAIWKKDYPERIYDNEAAPALMELKARADDRITKPPTFEKTTLEGLWFLRNIGELGSHPEKFDMCLNQCVSAVITAFNVCAELVEQGYE